MARKRDILKKIDLKTKSSGAPLPLIQEDQPASPAFYLIPAPDTLVLIGQAILRSTQAPLVAVAIGWQEAPNIAPDYYNVEWSESISFTDVQRARASTTSATISGLKANGITYYFRVQAVAGGIYSPFSETLSVVTMTDITPPPDVTGAVAAFQNSDLVITYTIPLSEIIKDVEIKIYNAAHSILYGTFYTTSQRFVWTAEQNIFATGGIPLTSVSVDIHTRSWNNYLSTTGVNVTATSTIPTTPSPTFNWTGDNGTADEDLVITWAAIIDADSYDLSLDGTTYKTRDLKFIYRYDTNVTQHTPTLASGDPSITWTLQARNRINQVSTAASGVVNNTAPPSGVMSLTALPGFSQIAVNVALLGATIIQDFDHYEWALLSGAVSLRSFISTTPDVIITLSGSGTYGVQVKAVDKFNQKSVATTVSGIVMDVLTIDQLRAETTYIDSTGASSPALDFLKDGLTTGTNKVYSPSGAGVYQWIEARRPLIDRYKTITFAATYLAAVSSYLSFDNGSTTTYYAGPVTTGTSGQQILTKYTTQANAISNAFDISAISLTRIELPNIQEARTIRIYFSNPSHNLTVYEYYPRRLVQSDDIEAENIKTINLAVGSVTADRISVITLSAITANIGGLVIDTTGYLWQGTGTAGSPTTGLKIYNSGGVGKLSTYNGGVEQITLDTDGKFKWGAGTGVAESAGIYIIPTTAMADLRSYGFKGTNFLGGIYASENVGGDIITVWKKSNTSKNSTLKLEADAPASGFTPTFTVFLQAGLATSTPFNAYLTDSAGSAVTEISAQAGNGKIYLRSPAYTDYALYIGQTTYNFSWDAGNTRYLLNTSLYVTGAFVSGGDIYWGTGGNYLSAYLNQAVLTTSNPTFNILNAAGVNVSYTASPRITINTTSGANARSEVYFSKNSAGGWLLGTDVAGNNTNDFFFFDAVNSQNRLDIGPAGNVQIQQKLYIGAIGTTPTALIHLATDSALKPTTTTWQTTSTVHAKENIKTRTNALDRIRKLRLTDYELNGKYHTVKGAKGVGFIAEELKDIYPNAVEEIVYVNDDGIEESYLASNPHEIFMDSIAAIQELLAEIDRLKAKI